MNSSHFFGFSFIRCIDQDLDLPNFLVACGNTCWTSHTIYTHMHTPTHTHIPSRSFLHSSPSQKLTHTHLILDIHSLTYEPHGHIYYTHLTPLNSLNSSHSPHLTQPISFTFVPTSTVAFSDVFLFSVPFSVLNLCLIKLFTCGVIRSYNSTK